MENFNGEYYKGDRTKTIIRILEASFREVTPDKLIYEVRIKYGMLDKAFLPFLRDRGLLDRDEGRRTYFITIRGMRFLSEYKSLSHKLRERKKSVADLIEETFSRYEPKEEAVEMPNIEIRREPAVIALPTIEVKPIKLEATGIPGLDVILGGGLPDHNIILVSGMHESHYETFIRQILYNYLCQGGKVAYYREGPISSDILMEMESFGWEIRRYISRENLLFINLITSDLQQLAEVTPQKLKMGYNLNLTENLDGLKSSILQRIREDRWIVLELSRLLNLYDPDEITNLLLYWRAAARIYGGVHFIMIPEGIHPENYVNAIRHLADGAVDFHITEDNGTFMVIRKLRTIKKPLRIAFSIGDDGIYVERTPRIL